MFIQPIHAQPRTLIPARSGPVLEWALADFPPPPKQQRIALATRRSPSKVWRRVLWALIFVTITKADGIDGPPETRLLGAIWSIPIRPDRWMERAMTRIGPRRTHRSKTCDREAR